MHIKFKPSRLMVIACAVVLALMWLFPQSQQVANAATTDPFCTQQLGPWQPAAPIPNNHVEGASAVVGGKLYIFTGFSTATLVPSNQIDIYNPATDIWETVAAPRNPMPFAASHIQAAADGRYIWIVGGFAGPNPGPPTDAVWRYDTINDLWVAGPPLPAARGSGAVVRNGRNLHFFGGMSVDRNIDHPDHWILNLDNPVAWTAAAPLPDARNHLNGVSIDGVVFAVGGQFGHDGPDPIEDQDLVHAYLPQSDRWVPIVDMLMPRSHAEPGTFVLNDRIIVAGGRNNRRPPPHNIETISEYNPQTGVWTDIAVLPMRLLAPVATVIGDQFIVTAGGEDYDLAQQMTWVADVISNCVVAAPAPPPAPAPTVSLSIGMAGALATNAVGRVGDTVTWVVTIDNVGSSSADISVNVELDPKVAFADIELLAGTYSVSGQTITVNIGTLGLGGSFTFRVTSTISARTFTSTLISTAVVSPTGQEASAIVRVLPPVTALPSTGETPLARSLFFAAAGILGLLSLAAGLLFSTGFRFARTETAVK